MLTFFACTANDILYKLYTKMASLFLVYGIVSRDENAVCVKFYLPTTCYSQGTAHFTCKYECGL